MSSAMPVRWQYAAINMDAMSILSEASVAAARPAAGRARDLGLAPQLGAGVSAVQSARHGGLHADQGGGQLPPRRGALLLPGGVGGYVRLGRFMLACGLGAGLCWRDGGNGAKALPPGHAVAVGEHASLL
ncbi:hypothetical protein [Streptomyces sp. NPDC031705]|uniref:hypothetical protein n=1 Tax=Streptomyces sp. NPDC031705 TaxID=3155729 RepID=UPI0033BFF9BA